MHFQESDSDGQSDDYLIVTPPTPRDEMGQLMAAKGSTSTRQNDKTDEYVLQSLASQGYKLNDEYSVAISAYLFLVSHFEDQTRCNSIHYFHRNFD